MTNAAPAHTNAEPSAVPPPFGGESSIDATILPDDKRPDTWWLWRPEDPEGRNRRLSPIVRRILTVNVIALAILVGSLLYLGRYQDRIVANELESLLLQSRIIAGAVAENAVVVDENDQDILSPLLARLMVRRLAETAETRTRLFDMDDTLLADSRIMLATKAGAAQGANIQISNLTAADDIHASLFARLVAAVFSVIDLIHERREYPLYQEQEVQRASHYEVVRKAMGGATATQVWRTGDGHLTLAASVPVQHGKNILGAVMMSRLDSNIDKAITTVRIDIMQIFLITLLITILLSLYLARAIARPIRILALAAEGLRQGQMQIVGLVGTAKLLGSDAIPDMTDRHDEIGDLSGALRGLTAALAQRIGAIENFAADVAHEIKNPLTSLRSAVETAERVQDPASKQRLMAVIRDDVDRLDRLISDISNASRLDAELTRGETKPVDIGKNLQSLIDHHKQDKGDNKSVAEVVLEPSKEKFIVMGIEPRLVQVFQNLIDNALSFSPPEKKVILSVKKEGRFIRVMIEDSGPGIPENKLGAIFDRFYSERPKAEKFGTHSGLGLSISKQIVEAHRGRIWAENRKGAGGHVVGARFVVRLPEAED